MTSRRSRPRRLLLPTLLAAVLVGEITGLALARSLTTTVGSGDAPARPIGMAGTVRDTDRQADALRPTEHILDTSRDDVTSGSAVTSTEAPARIGPGTAAVSPVHETTAPQPVLAPTKGAATKAAPPASSASYHGKNHLWIPSLGINRSVHAFPCSRTRPPDNYMYRWGCAGRNNVYLLGHSYGVFKPLHDAYVGGRLRKGMKVMYADGAGRVLTYSVIWWRVVKPTTAASWAWAAQSRPSMTLQTCVGARSQYRLMVRLVQVD